MNIEKARELARIIKSKNFADMEGAGMPEFGNYEENMQLAKEVLSALDEPVCKTCNDGKKEGWFTCPVCKKPMCQQPPKGDVISMIQSVSEGHTISLGEAKQRLSDCQRPCTNKPMCETCGGSRKVPVLCVECPVVEKDQCIKPYPCPTKPCPDCQKPPESEFTKECRELIKTDDDDKGWERESGYIVWLEIKLEAACSRLDAQQQTIKNHLKEIGILSKLARVNRENIDAQQQRIEDILSGHFCPSPELAKHATSCNCAHSDRHRKIDWETIDKLQSQLAKSEEAIKYLNSQPPLYGVTWRERQEKLKRILGETEFERIKDG